MASNKSLLRGLDYLNEEIHDITTGSTCTLRKAWDIIVRGYEWDNMPELIDRVKNGFIMKPYQFEAISDMAEALEIICN